MNIATGEKGRWKEQGRIHLFTGEKTLCGRRTATIGGTPLPAEDAHASDCPKCLQASHTRQQTADEQGRAKEARRRWYAEFYLNTEHWRDLRLRVLERADHCCEGCQEARATEVHHLTYEHIGHEMLWELVAVCAACHGQVSKPEEDEHVANPSHEMPPTNGAGMEG